MSKPCLKQEWDLSLEDLERHKVWVAVHGIDTAEPWYDDDDVDEATFRPWDGNLPASLKVGRLLILATMQLHCGRILPGAIISTQVFSPTPFDLGAGPISETSSAANTRGEGELIGYHQPRLFVNGRTYYLWGGLQGVSREARHSFYSALGLESDGIFPLRYAGEPGLADGATSGVALGFYRLISLMTTIVEN